MSNNRGTRNAWAQAVRFIDNNGNRLKKDLRFVFQLISIIVVIGKTDLIIIAEQDMLKTRLALGVSRPLDTFRAPNAETVSRWGLALAEPSPPILLASIVSFQRYYALYRNIDNFRPFRWRKMSIVFPGRIVHH